MESMIQNIAFAVSFVSLLFAFHLWTARSALHAASAILGICFFVLSVQLVLLIAALEFGRDHWWIFIRPALAMTVGPIAWLYFSSAANAAFKMKYHHTLHFIPAILISMEMLFGIIVISIDHAIMVSFAAYAIVLVWNARLGETQFSRLGDGASLVYRWLIVGAAILASSSIGEFAIIADIQRGLSISQSPTLLVMLILDFLLIGYAILSVLRHPTSFDWMYETREKPLAMTPGTYQQEDYEHCIARLKPLIENEKIHTQEGITIRVVAKSIGVPVRLLSEAINRTYGESFSRYMNRRRVELAQQLLHDHAGLPMADVMFDSGFQTKSSFNKEFRAVTGETPSGFRRRMRSRGSSDGA